MKDAMYKVCVMGLGKIGLRVASYISKYFLTIGYDINEQAVARALKTKVTASTTVDYGDVYVIAVNTYLHPENLPSFIPLVFSSQDPDGSKILIYNTTDLINGEFRYEAVPFNRFDNLTGLNATYGKLSLDYESVKEGNASIELSSQPSPNWANQSVAKIYEDIAPLDLSKVQSLSLWVKSDTNLQGNLFLQVFDANDNWGLYYLPQTDVNQWQNITISVMSSSSHSATYPDLSKIQRIVFGVYEIPDSFTIWLDNLTVSYLIESNSSYIK